MRKQNKYQLSVLVTTFTYLTRTESFFFTKAYKYDEKGFDTSLGLRAIEKINNGYRIEYKYNLSDDILEVLDPVSKDKGLVYNMKNEYDGHVGK